MSIRRVPFAAGVAAAATAAVLAGPAAMAAPAAKNPGYQPVMTSPDFTDQERLDNGFVPAGTHREPRLDHTVESLQDGVETWYGFCPDGYTAGRVSKTMPQAATNGRGWEPLKQRPPKTALRCVQPKAALKTALPKWMPEQPTPADLRRLGEEWGKDATVAVALTVPMPDLATCIPAKLPTGYLTDVTDYEPHTADWADGIEGKATATWRFEGGSGLMYSSYRHIGNPVASTSSQESPPDYLNVSYYPALNAQNPLEITTPASVYSAGRAWFHNGDPSFDAWYVGWDYSAGVVPDCGQANLPQSLVRMWDIPRLAWEDKNSMAPDEYTALTHRVLGPRNDVASATWMDGPVHPKYWTSEPGTANH